MQGLKILPYTLVAALAFCFGVAVGNLHPNTAIAQPALGPQGHSQVKIFRGVAVSDETEKQINAWAKENRIQVTNVTHASQHGYSVLLVFYYKR